MFCPRCKDEFRAGFTRCANCDIELVESLDAPGRAPAGPVPPRVSSGSLGDYCGFLSMDDAKQARDKLRGAGIRSEIAVRDAAEGGADDEYWLRVDVTRLVEVAGILGFDADETDDAPGFECGACGDHVDEDASACPHCGARFDE